MSVSRSGRHSSMLAARVQTARMSYRNKLEQCIQQLSDQRERNHRQDNLEVASILNQIGWICDKLADFETAIDSYTHSLAMYTRVLKTNVNEQCAFVLSNTALTYDNMLEFAKSLECNMTALNIYSQLHKGDHFDTATVLNNIGLAHHNLGDFIQALKYYLQSLDMKKRLYRDNPNNPDLSMALSNLGGVYNFLGDFPKAVEFYNQALLMNQAIHNSSDHIDIVNAYNCIGFTYKNMGEFKRAMEYFELALRMNRNLAPNGNQYTADCFNNIGLCLNNLKEYMPAINKYFDALRIFETIYGGEDHPAIAITLNNIALAYSLAGDFSKSAKFYADSLEMNRRLFGDEHPSVALILTNLGGMYNLAKDYTRSIEFYQRALDVQTKIMPPNANHPDMAVLLSNMGDVYKSLTQWAQAVEYYKRALDIYRSIVGNVSGRVVQFEVKIESLMVSVAECYERMGDKAGLTDSRFKMDNFKKKNYSKACLIS